jgi:hypothetical protein
VPPLGEPLGGLRVLSILSTGAQSVGASSTSASSASSAAGGVMGLASPDETDASGERLQRV